MKQYTKEVWTGCFLLIGIGLLLYSSIFFNGRGMLPGRHYNIQAIFSNTSGLQTGASVRIAGVPIGSVDTIALTLDNSMALVTLAIEK
ncbi:MAG: MlaD family protein, partial [Desulfovibrionaceae bacterium]|nr:MlaD family protein [Desulfovibrionaceae bacterium]